MRTVRLAKKAYVVEYYYADFTPNDWEDMKEDLKNVEVVQNYSYEDVVTMLEDRSAETIVWTKEWAPGDHYEVNLYDYITQTLSDYAYDSGTVDWETEDVYDELEFSGK